MSAPRLVASNTLHLDGADAPSTWTLWHDDNILTVVYNAGPNQSIGFYGTPQEVRLALASGLAAIDRAVAERTAAEGEELRAADVGVLP